MGRRAISRKTWRTWRCSAAAAICVLLVGCRLDAGGKAFAAATGPYARPGRLVPLDDGRALNLRCEGRGKPTVILESGWGGSSSGWSAVAPTVARTTRVCAYDRAGYGFSDPGPLPRDGAAIVRDLNAALARAGEAGPFILVGHSAGGLYVRILAAHRPTDVKGLILLDTTVEARIDPPQGDGLGGIRDRLQRCLAIADASPPPGVLDPAWGDCIHASMPPHEMKAAQQPATWRSQLSELDNIFTRTSEQVFRAAPVIRPIPTYVITASQTADASPPSIRGASLWELRHRAIAASSTRGFQRTILSSHLVMVDRPDVVLQAILEMVASARDNRPPAELAPDERLIDLDASELRDLVPGIDDATGFQW